MPSVSGTRWAVAGWLAVLAAGAALLWLFSSILLPFVLGMVLAYLLDPAVDRCEEWGLGRSLGTTMVLIGAALAFLAFTALLLPVVVDQAGAFAEQAPERVRRVLASLDRLRLLAAERFGWTLEGRAQDLLPLITGQVGAWALQTLQNLFQSGVALVNIVGLLVVTPIVAWYLLRDWDSLVARADALLPRHHLETIRTRFAEVDGVLAGFVRGQALVCVLLAALYAAGLGLLGVPNGVFVGIFAGLIAFVPYAGTVLGLVLAVGLAALEFGLAWQTAAAAAVFVAGQVLDDYVLRPRLVGARLGLHPVGTIFALFAGGALLGFLGVLIAVPAAAVITVLLRAGLAWYRASAFFRNP